MLLDELQVDYAMKRGHEMIVDMKSGIKRDQLDPIEIQMLQGQRIPKLLPVEWIDIDGGITFRYPLNGKRMLMHRLQTQQMTMFQFYTLLLAVVEALDDGRHYMLRAENFLLHEQYIFIGENWDDAVLAYVPLRGKRMVISAGEAVLAMAIRWVGAVEEPDGIGLQQVFQHLRGEFVSWELLRQALLALLGSSYRAELADHAAGHAAHGTIANAEARVVSTPREGKLPFENPAIFMDKHEQSLLDSVWHPANERERNRPEEIDLPLTEIPDQSAAEPARTGWMVGAGWILAAAVVWRFLYLASPSRTSLLLCSGLTLLTGAAALFLFRRLRSNRTPTVQTSWKAAQEWTPEDAFVPNSMQFGASSSPSQKSKIHAPEPAAIPGSEPREREVMPPVLPSRRGFASAQAAATNDVTVLLGQAAKESSGTDMRLPWLERQAEGQAEKIKLDQLHFIIGRSNEGVHYIDQSSGISRAHVELLGSSGRWSVKDMGSRNGSTLNGSNMVPYKTYELADTDKLQLAGEQGPVYVFRAG